MSKPLSRLFKPWAITATLAVWSLFFAACMTTGEKTVVTPAAGSAGATFVGSKECATCHDEKAGNFAHASHARISVPGVDGKDLGSCEACHGPASQHVKAGDGKHIINPGRNPETCYRCHIDKRAEFALPNAHPVKSGKIACIDCHEMHSGKAIKGGNLSLENEKASCTACHTAQKGPFVFQHNAMREGCTICHNPHGTVNKKMLVQRDNNLCLKCHLETQVTANTVPIVGSDHASRMGRGTCWSAGCHEAPHGSNASATFRY